MMIPNSSPRPALRSDSPQPRKRFLERQSSQPGSNCSIAESLAISNNAKSPLLKQGSRLANSTASLPIAPLSQSNSPGGFNTRPTMLTPNAPPKMTNRTVTDFPVQQPHIVPNVSSKSDDSSSITRTDLNRKRAMRAHDEEASLGPSWNLPYHAHRSALQKMRAARMHEEEAILHEADARAAKLGKFPASVAMVTEPTFFTPYDPSLCTTSSTTMPAPTTFDFDLEGFFGGPDRHSLQKRRAARLHEEEALLYIAAQQAGCHNDGGDDFTLPSKADDTSKLEDAPRMIPSRRALQRKRAARMHEEEASLYELDTQRSIHLYEDDPSAKRRMQRMRADRMHTEEARLYQKDDKDIAPQLQQPNSSLLQTMHSRLAMEQSIFLANMV